MPNVSINYWAVLVAAAINMVVGAIWYSKPLFAKPWAKATGRKMEQMGNGAKGYVFTVGGALVEAWILAHFVRYADSTTVLKGALTGFWLWLAFVAITSAVNTIFAGRPWKLWQIDAGYFLVVLLLQGALLAVWR